MTQTFAFPNCWLHIDAKGHYLHTAFPDGTKVESVPHPAKDRITARAYGYGDDAVRLWREHDLLHHWVGTHFGHGYSPTIWAVAHPEDPNAIPRWARLDEERFLGHIHLWLNLGQWHNDLHAFGDSREDVVRVLEGARQLLNSIEC